MNPIITNLVDEENIFKFTIKDINVSLANALRRIILSEIPTVVFRTSPHDKNDAIITTNTSRFNNEIIKQRLSCIPIKITDPEFPLDEHIIEVDVINDTQNIIYVTSKDFKIKNINTGKYLNDVARDEIFQPDKITGDYIDFVRLRPKLSDNIPGEQLSLSCKFSIGTAKENGAFNITSTCSYGATLDPALVSKTWTEREKQIKSANNTITREEIALLKRDWLLLDAKRLVIANSFDFIIESVGVYTNFRICELGCNVLIERLKTVAQNFQEDNNIISKSMATIENCYDITLENEDFTIGKILEYVIFEKNFNKEITFCGFKKPHPHVTYSILRLAFKEDVDNIQIIAYLLSACEINIQIFERLKENFVQK